MSKTNLKYEFTGHDMTGTFKKGDVVEIVGRNRDGVVFKELRTGCHITAPIAMFRNGNWKETN